MHLDRRFQLRVVGKENIGIASADMGSDHTILALKLFKQLMRGMRVGAFVPHVGRVGNLRVGRSMDGLTFVSIVNIAIAADGGVGGPLVSRDADKVSWTIKLGRQTVQLVPEVSGNLKVVALMTHDVEKCFVASEFKIFPGGISSERLVRLAMGISPEIDELGICRSYAQGVRAAEFVPVPIKHADCEIAGLHDFKSAT